MRFVFNFRAKIKEGISYFMKIAFLTAGGIAPCLSSSIGALIEKYNILAPETELMGY